MPLNCCGEKDSTPKHHNQKSTAGVIVPPGQLIPTSSTNRIHIESKTPDRAQTVPGTAGRRPESGQTNLGDALSKFKVGIQTYVTNH